MKTYNGMTRQELIEKIATARVEQMKKRNFEKFGNNDFPKKNENIDDWKKLYKTYPMESKKYNGMFSLVYEYKRFYEKTA